MTKIMILSGFLGAGKTTLLKRMLSWKTDLSGTVIIVNDFGKVGSHSSRESLPPSDAQSGKQEPGPVTADSYVTFSYEGVTGFSEDHFIRFVEGLPRQMFRIKGPVQFEDRTVLLNYVGGKVQWAPWEGHPETRLAFIGWDISEAAILPALEKCLATHCVPPLSGRNRNG